MKEDPHALVVQQDCCIHTSAAVGKPGNSQTVVTQPALIGSLLKTTKNFLCFCATLTRKHTFFRLMTVNLLSGWTETNNLLLVNMQNVLLAMHRFRKLGFIQPGW